MVTNFSPHKTITCALWLSDQVRHPLMNEVAVIGVRSGTETYILPIYHYDAGSRVITKDHFIDLVKDCIIQTNDKKKFLQFFGSVATVQQMGTDPEWGYVDGGPYLYHINNTDHAFQSVPLVKIAEWLELILDQIENKFVQVSSFFNDVYIPTLVELEQPGIRVDVDKFSERYPDLVKKYVDGNRLYTNYYPFTTTGRASNALGINFSALNKSTGVRDMFVSRFIGGHLVGMDFEAYHLRLIANEFKLTLPSGSLHRELAKIYFNTNDITDELYQESKRKTFEIIYGMTTDIPDFELFAQICFYRNEMWHDYNLHHSITLPTGVTVAVHDANPSKVFNYYVQALEVVKTIPKLQQITQYLRHKDSKLVLYTYDSILLDVHPEEAGEIVPWIANILEEDGKYPVRKYTGLNYNDMKEMA